MRVAGYRVYRFGLPLAAPLDLAGRRLRRREGLLLELTAEGGASAWGEASPLPGFSPESLEEALEELLRLASRTPGEETSGIDTAGAPPSVRFGLETAAHGLEAATAGETLADAFSDAPLRAVAAAALLSGAEERALEDADEAGRLGYRAAKLKVGGRGVERDAALAREVALRLGGGAELRLDANRSWSLGEAEAFVRLLEGTAYAYLEEPLGRPQELGELVRRTGAPVALDESLVGVEPGGLAEHGYASAVVLKPTLLGLSRSLHLAGEARRLGMRPVVSAAYEGGFGTRALVALAAATGGAPAGLDTYRRLADDYLSPRLPLPALEVDVRALLRGPYEVRRESLTLVGEGP